jgi:hypothetical protein
MKDLLTCFGIVILFGILSIIVFLNLSEIVEWVESLPKWKIITGSILFGTIIVVLLGRVPKN